MRKMSNGKVTEEERQSMKRMYLEEDMSMQDIEEEIDRSRKTISKHLNDMGAVEEKKRREEEGEDSEEDYGMETPYSCLETVLEMDPKLSKDKYKDYILNRAEQIFAGTMNSDELKSTVKDLSFKNKNNVAARVVNNYVSKINNELNSDPDMLREDVWRNFLEKEPNAPDPEEVEDDFGSISINGINISSSDDSEGSIELTDNDTNGKSTETSSKIKKLKKMKSNGGDITDLQSVLNGEESMGNIDEILDRVIDMKMKTGVLQMLQNGSLFDMSNNGGKSKMEKKIERLENKLEEKEKEEKKSKEEQHIMQLDRKLNKLAQTVQSESNGGNNPKSGLKERIQEINELSKQLDELKGETKNKKGGEDDKVVKTINQLRKELTNMKPNKNPDEMSPHEAEIEKKKIDKDIEQMRKEKEIDKVDRIVSTIGNNIDPERIGEGIGSMLMGGNNGGNNMPGGSSPNMQQPQQATPQAQQQAQQPTGNTRGNDSNEKVEQMLNGELEVAKREDGKVECPRCGNHIEVDEGATTAKCGDCGNAIQLTTPGR